MLPLFGAAGADELGEEADAKLPPMPPAEQVLTDYPTTRQSLKGPPMAFLSPPIPGQGGLNALQVAAAEHGHLVESGRAQGGDGVDTAVCHAGGPVSYSKN